MLRVHVAHDASDVLHVLVLRGVPDLVYVRLSGSGADLDSASNLLIAPLFVSFLDDTIYHVSNLS